MRSSTLWFVTVLAISACHGSGNDAAPQGSAGAPPLIDEARDRAIAAQAEAAAAEKAMLAAKAAAEKAQADAASAADRVEKLEKNLADQQVKLDEAVNGVANAKTQAEMAALQAKLAALQKQRAELEGDTAAAKQAAEQAARAKDVHISKECVDNPLAKGCS